MKKYTFFTVTGIENRAFENIEQAIKEVQTAYHTVMGYDERVIYYTVVKNTICENGCIKKEDVKRGVTDFAIKIWKKDAERYAERIEEHKAKIEKIKTSTKYKNENNRQKAIEKEENEIKDYQKWIDNIKKKIAI